MAFRFFFFAGVYLFFIPALAADNPRFALPLDCELGRSCWIAQYVDMNDDPSSHQDFMCTRKSYEGHKGTDFAVRSRAEMEAGVDVLAAADGEVLRVRDGEDDREKSRDELSAISRANKDCGNGVVIDHGHGYETMYCHLKQGSVVVKPGDVVAMGQKIAQVGQSGRAEFPHLHISILKDGAYIDPFNGQEMGAGCGKIGQSLWRDDVEYSPFTVFDGGFLSAPPDFDAIEAGAVQPLSLPLDAPALVYWVGFYQAQKGDHLTLSISNPNGSVLTKHEIVMEKDRARQYYFTGKKNKSGSWEKGVYTGRAQFSRNGSVFRHYTHSITVE